MCRSHIQSGLPSTGQAQGSCRSVLCAYPTHTPPPKRPGKAESGQATTERATAYQASDLAKQVGGRVSERRGDSGSTELSGSARSAHFRVETSPPFGLPPCLLRLVQAIQMRIHYLWCAFLV